MSHRLKWAALLSAAFLVALAGAYRWPISSAYVAAEFGRQLTHSVGLELRGPARATLTLLPLPSIQITDLDLRGEDGAAVIAAPSAKVQLALAPLFLGHLRFSGAMLRRPTVFIDLDHAPFAADSALARLIDRRNPAADKTPLGALRFEGGLVHIVSAQNGLDTLIEDVAGELDWSSLVDPLRLELHAIWRDAPLKISARFDDPSAWLAGGASPALIELASPAASLSMNGALKSAQSGLFEGALAVDVVSISALTRLLGEAPALSAGRASFARRQSRRQSSYDDFERHALGGAGSNIRRRIDSGANACRLVAIRLAGGRYRQARRPCGGRAGAHRRARRMERRAACAQRNRPVGA